jgi:hypothetical protein
VPRPVWGRDELKAGEMWNSNSVIAWLIASAGLTTETLRPPPHGRAPGWLSGLAVARGTLLRLESLDHLQPGAASCRDHRGDHSNHHRQHQEDHELPERGLEAEAEVAERLRDEECE